MNAIAEKALFRPRTRPMEEPEIGPYSVAVYPPAPAWETAQAAEFEQALDCRASGAPLGIYVHIPFCEKKCEFCRHLSFDDQKPAAIKQYLDRLAGEMKIYAGRPAIQGRSIKALCFGGGTPSMLSPAQVRTLAGALRAALPWQGIEEITFECAPKSVRAGLLETLGEIGVTRLSMGVQSFDDSVLQLNGRIHLESDVRRAFALIRQAKFPCVNLDLMVGLPGDTAQRWRETVDAALQLGPDSVTIYQTEMPAHTGTCQAFQAGTLPALPASWDSKRARLSYAFDELEKAGFTVINAYTAVKDTARHRSVWHDHLWGGGDMLGLGAGSCGCVDGFCYQNETALADYEARAAAGKLPVQRALRLTKRSRLVREFVLQLKSGRVSPDYFQRKFGEDVNELLRRPLQRLAERGLLALAVDKIELTRAGLFRADRLLPEFFEERYRSAR